MAKKTSEQIIADQASQITALRNTIKALEDTTVSKAEAIARQMKELAEEEELSANKILEIRSKQLDVSKQMTEAYKRNGKAELAVGKELKTSYRAEKAMLETRLKEIKAQKESLKVQQEFNKLLEKRQKFGEKYADTFDKSLEFLDEIHDKIKEIPIVGDFLSKAVGVEHIKEKLVENFKEGFEKSGHAAGKFKLGMAGILGVAVAAAAVFKGFEMALELDQELTDMARGLGISKAAANDLHHDLLGIASTTKVVGATAHSLSEAYMQIAALTGQSVIENQKLLESQVLLTKQYGLSGEEAAAFQATSMATGKTTEQNLQVIKQITSEYNELTGDSLNFKEISRDIAKISKATLATYKGDVKALTMAAIQAKKLGMTLEETRAVSDKLLDIETSLEAEMTANVLTGKSMNMNAARQLALQGKTAEAAAEAVKQAGSYEEIMNMSYLGQQAAADAAGVTVDQLVQAAELKRISNALSGKEVKSMQDLSAEDRSRLISMGYMSEEQAKQLAIDEQRASTQEKFANAVENIKAAFANIASGPLGAIASAMSDILGNAAAMKGILTSVGVVLGIMAVNAIATMSALTLGIGAVAITAGIIAATNAMNSEKEKTKADSVGDLSSPADGKTIVSTKEGGLYELSKNDDLVAFPGASKIAAGGSGTGEVESLLRQLIAKVDQPVKINIGTRTVDELDTQITLRKTYNTKMDAGYGTFG